MKKILFLFALSVVLSCSSDDGDSTPLIVGTWKPVSSIQENSNDNSTRNRLTACEVNTRIIFNANKTIGGVNYYGNDLNDCDSDQITNISWSFNGNKLKYIYVNGEADEATITFSNNNNTMTHVMTEGPYRNIEVYSRVQ